MQARPGVQRTVLSWVPLPPHSSLAVSGCLLTTAHPQVPPVEVQRLTGQLTPLFSVSNPNSRGGTLMGPDDFPAQSLSPGARVDLYWSSKH